MSKLSWHLVVVIVALTGFACAGSGGESGATAAGAVASSSADEPAQLVFLDSRIFDEELSDAMSDETSKIVVQVPGAFSLNDIPERMDRWLYAVKDGGGKVAAEPENPSRGLVSAAIDLVVTLVGKIDEIRLYRPAQDYDATLLYREDGTVTRILFDRR